MASTTACEVGPTGLSIRTAPSSGSNSCMIDLSEPGKTPDGHPKILSFSRRLCGGGGSSAEHRCRPRRAGRLADGVERLFDGGNHAPLNGQRFASHTRPGRGAVPAATELAGDVVDVHLVAFRAQA